MLIAMAPPATLTLATVIERMRMPSPHIMLGIGQGQIMRDGDTWKLHEIDGAVIGVSPHDDRPGQIGTLLCETTDDGELVDRLVGELWTSRFGVMLGPRERLSASVSGIAHRVRLIARLRSSWGKDLPDDEAQKIVDGKRTLDGKQARILSTVVRELGGATRWTCVRS